MSVDESSSGDYRPDQAAKPEHRPFPGAADNRAPVPPPAGSRTFDEIRADRAKQAAPADDNAVKAADETVPRTPAKDAAIAGHGTADTAAARHTAAPPDRGHATQPDTTGSQRPGAFVHPERGQLRPFPGALDDRPPVPPPAGSRTFDEIRADRSKYRSTSEYVAAKNAEKAPAQQAAAKEIPGAAKESAAARPDAGTAAERAAGARDQGRGGSAQPERTTTRAREGNVSTEEASVAQTAKRGPGGKHPDAAAQPDGTAHSDHDGPKTQVSGGPHHRGSAGLMHNPDSSAAERGGKGGILHGHSEFHGRNLDLYTDGTHWTGGDAVRAAQAEAARARADGQPAPRRYGITDVPQMRDLGRNIVGEKEDRSPGDTSDLPPTGEQLLEPDDRPLPRAERLGHALDRDFDDVQDTVSKTASFIQEILEQPASGGPGHTVAIPREPVISQVPYQSPDVGSIAELGVVLGVAGWHAYRWTREKTSELSDKIAEWRDNRYAGN